MDPGILALVTLLAPWGASVVGIMTAIGGIVAGFHGHHRQDYHTMTNILVWGAISAGVVYTSPQWLPVAINAVSAMRL